MKKSTLFITTLLVVAAASVAVVSCKKDTTGQDNAKGVATQTFDPRQIEDMNAYLKAFKQKMQSATKGDDEALSLEDAAWHLSSVANYDFANINVGFDDIRFDTLYAHVDIMEGSVRISDLGLAYESIRDDIENHFQKMNLNEKHIRFIDAYISEDGYTIIPLVISFKNSSKDWDDYHWYYEPHVVDPLADTIAEDSCNSHFSDNMVYAWNGLARTELVRLLNIYEHHTLIGTNMPVVFYTKTREYTFGYTSYIDSYGSPSNHNSRLFGVLGNPYYVIPKADMCYYLDSYLGLGYDYLTDNPIIQNVDECPGIWSISTGDSVLYHDHSTTYYHILKVIYCKPFSNSSYN